MQYGYVWQLYWLLGTEAESVQNLQEGQNFIPQVANLFRQV